MVKNSTAHLEESTSTTLVKIEYGERTRTMNRLKQLRQDHAFGKIKDSDKEEFITLLIKEVNFLTQEAMKEVANEKVKP